MTGNRSAFRDWRVWALVGVILLGGLLKTLRPGLEFTPLLAAPVVVSAVLGRPRVTIGLGLLAIALGAFVGLARGAGGSGPFVPEILVASIVAVVLAQAVAVWKNRLLSEQRQYQMLAENSSDVVLRTGLGGDIEWVAPSASVLLGWDTKQVIGTPYSSFVLPDDHEVAFGGDLPTEVRRYDARILQADGSTRWMRAVCRPVAGDDGKVKARILSLSDIQAEVTERSEREAAVAASLAKSSFVAHMSHEIRTPLNAIVGYSHLLQESATTDRQRDYADKTVRSAAVLLSTVNDILDFSKIEADALEIEAAPLSVSAVIDDVDAVVGHLARAKGLDFVVEVDPHTPDALVGDSLRLKQVLLNLGGNAVKFTAHGSVTLVVEPVAIDEDETTVRFSVIDTGIGISEEAIDRLYEPFSQADSSTTRTHGGTGLGLTISERLVRLMGGHISITSAAGIGSTFSFELTLPRTVPAASATSSTGRAAGLAPGATASLAGARILVAEDDLFNQEIAAELLTAAGAHVEIVDNGQAVLDLLGTGATFDVVLMDVQMPVMDGLEATRRIRSQADTQDLVVIAMTASALTEDFEACRDAGMNDFASKPIDPSELHAKIGSWIS